MPKESKFGQELNTLVAYYFDTHINIDLIRPDEKNILYFDKFLSLMSRPDKWGKNQPTSCLINEIITKSTMPAKHTKESVFIATLDDIKIHHTNPRKFPYSVRHEKIDDEFLES